MPCAGQDHAASRLRASPDLPTHTPAFLDRPSLRVVACSSAALRRDYQIPEIRHGPMDINPNEEDFP